MKNVKELKKAIVETVHEINKWMKQAEDDARMFILSNPPASSFAEGAIEKLQKLDDELTELEKESKDDA